MARRTTDEQPAVDQGGSVTDEQPAAVEAASRDHEIAAAKRAKAAGGRTDDEIRQDAIDGLLAERRGYVQRGLESRVASVDEQLERLGHKA